MPSKIYSCALKGLDAYGLEIEVDLMRGLSRFTVVGLPDAAVQESRERVRSAMVNSGAAFPGQRKVVNLAPADRRKTGPSLDLPIAVGLLAVSGQVPTESTHGAAFLGELALDGTVRSVPGVLSCALWARDNGFESLYLPAENVAEALLAIKSPAALKVYGVRTLRQLIEHLRGESAIPAARVGAFAERRPSRTKPLPPLNGGRAVLRALTVASAGGHHLLLSGPPGSGKTLLAHHLPALLPPLSDEESFELTRLYSAAGRLPSRAPLVSTRPFRSVHSSASAASLLGGRALVPGEISLAHRGVLFLDEFLEFPRALLESLRQPLEERRITVSRAGGSVIFPADFILVAAMNPCPCGYHGDDLKPCTCSEGDRRRYTKKLSGPLLDRIDLFVPVQRLSFDDLHTSEAVSWEELIAPVQRARAAQATRHGESITLNAHLTPEEVRRHCALSPTTHDLLRTASSKMALSARGMHRVLKVARTIADLRGALNVEEPDLMEALRYRLTEGGRMSS